MAVSTNSTYTSVNPRDDLDIEWIRQNFSYDPASGFLCKNGRRIGWEHSSGYRYYSTRGSSYKEHRIIWALVYGGWPTGQIDHINGVRNDNSLSNLRDVSPSQNQRAIRKPNRNNTTGYRGVIHVKRSNTFAAQIKISGKLIYLGGFKTAVEASKAYERKAESLRN